jgi:PASTA domain
VRNVGNYACMTFAAAKLQIVTDGFAVGTVTSTPSGHESDDTWIVKSQSIPAGTPKQVGTAIDLVLEDPTTLCAP